MTRQSEKTPGLPIICDRAAGIDIALIDADAARAEREAAEKSLAAHATAALEDTEGDRERLEAHWRLRS